MIVGNGDVAVEALARAFIEIARRRTLRIVGEYQPPNAGRLGHLTGLASRTMPAHPAFDVVSK